MGKCLSRWCENIEEPISNGHTNGASHNVGGSSGHVPDGEIPLEIMTSPRTPNTPRSIHITVPSFICRNGGESAMPVVSKAIEAGAGEKPEASQRSLDMFFKSYRDPSEDSILVEGIERLCDDLNVKPDDFVVLVLAWRLGASAMCRFTRCEFVTGCQSLGIDSLSALRNRLRSVADDVANSRTHYRDLYRWAYRFALDPSSGHRTLSVDVAVAMWRVVFSAPAPSRGVPSSATWAVPLWLEFLERHGSIRGITRDTWDMLLNFLDSLTDPSMSGYDETEAWPSHFDDFVKWVHERHRRPSTDVVANTDEPTKIDSC